MFTGIVEIIGSMSPLQMMQNFDAALTTSQLSPR
jgi:hypothetical protein